MKRSSIELRPNCKQYKIGEFIGPNSILLLNNYEDDYIKFDESTWDGSDFFTLKNTGITACTKKLKIY